MEKGTKVEDQVSRADSERRSKVRSDEKTKG